MYRILFIFILVSSFVFGATNIPDNHIIYTWGYGKMIYQVLEAVAMAVQNAGQLIKSVLLLAFAFVAIKKILDGRVQYFAEVVKFSVISALLIGFSFTLLIAIQIDSKSLMKPLQRLMLLSVFLVG